MKRGDQEGAGHRHLRLEQSILEELRAILRDDISDPVLEGARFSAVVLSPDYRSARVHFLTSKGSSRPDVERAFERAGAFMRGRLAEAIELKRTPELRFVFEAEAADGLD
ncbi:MAG: ribosome-binding factor A [Deltaproteobacteria bacterium]|nr:ribosome-binding factor A [Deltaproteobacteria bacterium]